MDADNGYTMDLWAVSTFEEVVPGHGHDGPDGLHGREHLPQPEHHLDHPPLVLGLLTTREDGETGAGN